MPTGKFIFKVYRDGYVERIEDKDNITVSDVSHWLGVDSTHIECKPIKNSEVCAFYGDEKSELLVFAVLIRKSRRLKRNGGDVVRGILASQFNMLAASRHSALMS